MNTEQYYIKKLQQGDISLLYKNIFEEVLWEDLYNTNSAAYPEYQIQLNRIVDSANEDIYLYYIDNNPIGYLRMIFSTHIANVSYSLNKTLRGQGFGRKLINLIEDEIINNLTQIDQINITVKSNNIALQRKLEESNFVKVEENNCMYYMKKIYIQETENKYNLLSNQNKDGVLLLTNNNNALVLYEWLKQNENRVLIYSNPINEDQIAKMNVEYIISYNYSHIIKKNVIDIMDKRIINLHISLLPWNRGANPNFWSFIEDTPKGVTIHYIDEGLDTGDTLLQVEVKFDEEKETFRSTYQYLHNEIVNLLIHNWMLIKEEKITAYKSKENGTYHSVKDFSDFTQRNPIDWDETIYQYKRKIYNN